MVDQTSLSNAQRTNILESQRVSRFRQTASERLSTGRSISRISDNPQDFLQASALNNRADNLLEAKSSIGLAIDSLSATQTGISAINKLSKQLKGIALIAQSATGAERTALAEQFDTLREQIGNIAGDTSFLGRNLLNSPASELKVSISDKPETQYTIEGDATDATSLGIGSAAGTYNNFASASDIENALTSINEALSGLASRESNFGSDISSLQVREKFNKDLANIHEDGANQLTEADTNVEAARLLASQVRDGFAQQNQRITANSNALLVSLISGS